MELNYLETAKEVYRDAALEPKAGLCCTTTPVWKLPELHISKKMLEMNYGCGSTVHPRDLSGSPTVLYVGVGGGMELLQFAYFSRHPRAVIGIDPVKEMREVCRRNLSGAQERNPWFREEFVELRSGTALSLELPDRFADVAAQNCLFNIFKPAELKMALAEFFRVLRPGGRMILSDPICQSGIPDSLKNNQELRSLCLTGALPLEHYIHLITEAGFGTVEVRARRPYRVLDPNHYDVEDCIFIESVEVCAIKDPMPKDGPCVFTGKTAIYFGENESFDDGNGHHLQNNLPLSICDKTAHNLKSLDRRDLLITESTYFYDGGGCC